MDGSLMAKNKTLKIELEDLRAAIINQILEYETHIFEPRDESFNAGIHQAIEAVKEAQVGN